MSTSDRLLTLLKLHDPNATRLVTRESTQIEFKQAFHWSSRALYAKTMAAFANHKGGFIVFGVTNAPRNIVGLSNDSFERLDEASVALYLNASFAPALDFEKGFATLAGQTMGYFYIHSAERKPVICTQNDGDNREGDIYFRYNARSQRIKHSELVAIIAEVENSERQRWLSLFERIGRIGINHTALLDTHSGKIEGDRGMLLIDESLLSKIKFVQEGRFREAGKPTLRIIGDVQAIGAEPVSIRDVRITTSSDAAQIQLSDDRFMQLYPLDYEQLTNTLRNRYTNFLTSKEYHDKRKEFSSDPNYVGIRYLDPIKKKSKKEYYSQLIIEEFDKVYKRRVEDE